MTLEWVDTARPSVEKCNESKAPGVCESCSYVRNMKGVSRHRVGQPWVGVVRIILDCAGYKECKRLEQGFSGPTILTVPKHPAAVTRTIGRETWSRGLRTITEIVRFGLR